MNVVKLILILTIVLSIILSSAAQETKKQHVHAKEEKSIRNLLKGLEDKLNKQAADHDKLVAEKRKALVFAKTELKIAKSNEFDAIKDVSLNIEKTKEAKAHKKAMTTIVSVKSVNHGEAQKELNKALNNQDDHSKAMAAEKKMIEKLHILLDNLMKVRKD